MKKSILAKIKNFEITLISSNFFFVNIKKELKFLLKIKKTPKYHHID
jgi:hypothetical protein